MVCIYVYAEFINSPVKTPIHGVRVCTAIYMPTVQGTQYPPERITQAPLNARNKDVTGVGDTVPRITNVTAIYESETPISNDSNLYVFQNRFFDPCSFRNEKEKTRMI